MSGNIVVEIVNKKGLHARAAAKFVKTVANSGAQVLVVKLGQDGEEPSAAVAGASILGLMMLGADPGSKLYITADGEGSQEVLAALQELVDTKFGEPE
jgi:phosphocarrier protein HPr